MQQLVSGRVLSLLSIMIVVMGVISWTIASPRATEAASVTPVYQPGNPSCQDLGYDYGFKVDPPNSGTYDVPGLGTVTVDSDGTFFDWSSTFGIDAVIAKGGPNANLYVYDPPAESMGDTDLVSPINPNNGQPFGLSHIEFCYDIELVVTKTAETSVTRTYEWTVEKSADQADLTLSTGQSFPVNYDVVVDSSSSSDSDFAVSGVITVHNPAPVAATVTGVTDVITDGINATVDCGVVFPVSLGAGEDLECTYSTALPDATDWTNTATATTTGTVGGDSGTAAVSFAAPTVTPVDDCVDVTDSLQGFLGEVCIGDDPPPPTTFEYTREIGPYTMCGEFTVDNTANIVTNTSGTEDEDSWLVNVHVPCDTGCTLTQGYWKTHSALGPAPYDDTWAQIGENTTFYSSGQSYYQVLWTAPAGNAYYNLAHQYIAAKLNTLNGASVPANVQTAFNTATTLFQTNTPATIAGLRGNSALRAQFTSLASTLAAYNEGTSGPLHCSE